MSIAKNSIIPGSDPGSRIKKHWAPAFAGELDAQS
jgi:hypothetical protein